MKIITISLLCVATLLCNSALSEERLKLLDNAYESTLENIVKSINEENLDAYMSCFAVNNKKYKSIVAEFFLRTECSVDILEKHLLEKTEKSAKVAISYKTVDVSNNIEHIHNSIVALKKIQGIWKISGEKVLSYNYKDTYSSCNSCNSSPKEQDVQDVNACFGGRCKL